MRRTILIAVAAGVALLALIVVLLGVFPPRAHPVAVVHVIPNEHFQAR